MTTLAPQEQEFLAKLRAGGFRSASRMPLAESRASLRDMALSLAGPKLAVDRVEDHSIAGPGGNFMIRIYKPDPTTRLNLGVTLFLHGGGFYLGDLETHDHVCRFLCVHAGTIVIAVDYRLAPENKFPAGLEDCYAALCWVAANGAVRGWDSSRIALLGDSAGGTLVAATCLLARQRGGPAISLQAMVYPALAIDDGVDFPSRTELGNGDYFVSFEDFAFIRQIYLEEGERDVADPLASPVRAKDFRNLPPALIVAAEFDPCRDENRRYAELLKAAGVPTEFICFEGTIHPFYILDGILDAGRRGQELVADRIRRALIPAAPSVDRA